MADDAPGERMWVDVTAVNGDHITGLLASDPMFLPLERDDIITGTLANVLDIRDAKAYRPPEADAPQPSGLH